MTPKQSSTSDMPVMEGLPSLAQIAERVVREQTDSLVPTLVEKRVASIKEELYEEFKQRLSDEELLDLVEERASRSRISYIGTAPVIDGQLRADLASGASNQGSSLIGFVQSGSGAIARAVQDVLRERISVLDFIPVALHAGILAGTDETNHTTYITAAITQAEATTYPKDVFFPSGRYNLSTATIKRTRLIGSGRGRVLSSNQMAGTEIRQISGATQNMIRILADTGADGTRRLFAGVKEMSLRGRRETNLSNLVRITAAASRTSFTCNTTDLAALTLPSSVANFPFYGYCFFYSSENRYLGHGVVSNINTGTGAITLVTGWDNYATKTGETNLTSTEKVIFSGSGNFDDVSLDGQPDITMAGLCGIETADDVHGVELENLNFTSFHAMIARGTHRILQGMGTIWGQYNTMGIVNRALGNGADDYYQRLFIQGNYRRDDELSDESGTFDNSPYRDAAVNLYGIVAESAYEDATLNNGVVGILDYGGYGFHIGKLDLDGVFKYGWCSIQGTSNKQTGEVGVLRARTYVGTLPTILTAISGMAARAPIALTGQNSPQYRQLIIGTAHVGRSPSADAANDFAVFSSSHASGSNLLVIGNFAVDTQGLTAISTDSGLRYPLIANYVGSLNRYDPSTRTITTTFGAAAAGTSNANLETTTFSGDSGGTSDVRSYAQTLTASGGNAIAGMALRRSSSTYGASAAGTTIQLDQATSTVSSSGNVTNNLGFNHSFTLSSSGNVTTAKSFRAGAPTLSSTGAITTLVGFQSEDLGHATLVTNAIGFNAADITASATQAVGFRSQVLAGTGKYGFRATGTANNSLAGPLYLAQDSKAEQTAAAVYAGTGAPNNTNGSNGDFYFRGDGTAGANTVVYHKEGGSWVALVTT